MFFTNFKRKGFKYAEKNRFSKFVFSSEVFFWHKKYNWAIKCTLMDNKGHFHLQLSLNGHVNK